MPMGLTNSPATFQRCIDAVLGDLKWNVRLCYFDDIIIFSKTKEEHRRHLKLVLERLARAGFTMHPDKLRLFRSKIKFLGHIVKPGRVFPNPEKVMCIRKYPRPRNKRDVQKFMGLIGFYRKFVPNISMHARPITMFLREDVPFKWTEEAEEAFEFLKTVLTDLSELHLPDLNGQFIISTDASKVGLSAVLMQKKDGVRFPIWFASRCLKPAETRYSTPERECLAVIWAVEKFRGYIEYTKFILEKDHQALSWLQRIKEPSGRLAHWFLILQHYNFEVHHKPGMSLSMKVPDALSRIHEVLFVQVECNVDRSKVIQEQNIDSELFLLKSLLKGQQVPSCEQVNKVKRLLPLAHLSQDDMLYRHVGPKGKPWEEDERYWRIWIPSSLKLEVLSLFHESRTAGHLGVHKTYRRLEDRVYWFGMSKDVSKFVKGCRKCQESKVFNIPIAPASSFQPDSPWEVIATDLMGPFPRGHNQNVFLMVVVDLFSKFVELFPLRVAKSEKVVEKMNEVFCRYGLPRVVIVDNGSQYTSKFFVQWCESLGVQVFHIAVYHAQANITERYNQTVKETLLTLISKCKDWDRYLPEVAFAIRSAVNDSTKFSPAYLTYGRELRTPFDNLVNVNLPNIRPVKDLMDRFALVHSIARDNILKSQSVYLSNYNAKARLRDFKPDDLVWYKTHFLADASQGFTPKLAPKRELCKVRCRLSDTVYDLMRVSDGQKINKVHVNDLMEFTPSHLPK